MFSILKCLYFTNSSSSSNLLLVSDHLLFGGQEIGFFQTPLFFDPLKLGGWPLLLITLEPCSLLNCFPPGCE